MMNKFITLKSRITTLLMAATAAATIFCLNAAEITSDKWRVAASNGAIQVFYDGRLIVQDQRVAFNLGGPDKAPFVSSPAGDALIRLEEAGETKTMLVSQQNDAVRLERTVQIHGQKVHVANKVAIKGLCGAGQQNSSEILIPQDAFVPEGAAFTIHYIEQSQDESKCVRTNVHKKLSPAAEGGKQPWIYPAVTGLEWSRNNVKFLLSDGDGMALESGALDYALWPRRRLHSYLLDRRMNNASLVLHEGGMNNSFAAMKGDTLWFGFDLQAETGTNALVIPEDTWARKQLANEQAKGANTPLAYYMCLMQVRPLAPLTTVPTGGVADLPDELVIPPGDYRFAGRVYHLEQEGLYRFFHPPLISAQRVVYRNDLKAFLSAICWMTAHGQRDDWKPADWLSAQAMQRKLNMTCGNITNWAIALLKNIGIKARRVYTYALSDWNGYDNGHVLIEIYLPDLKKWVVHDLDCNLVPTRKGRYLSIVEFAEAVLNNEYDLEYLAADVNFSLGERSKMHPSWQKGADFGMWSEMALSPESHLRQWYARIAHAPCVAGKRTCYTVFSEKEHELMETYYRLTNNKRPFPYLEREAFEKEYYSEPEQTNE